MKSYPQRQLAAGKEQIKGQLAMSEENNLNQMMMMGRSILNRGYVPSLDEIFTLIQQTDAKKIGPWPGKCLTPIS
jgi:hypothetical protein